MTIEAAVAAMPGEAALPRRNGELVFQAPWESRAFGMAVALHEQGLYDWNDFRDRLIEELAAHRPGASYYECWLEALERVLGERQAVAGEELAARLQLLDREDEHAHRH